MPQTIEASAFIADLGVNVHLNFSGTPYSNLAAVQTAMTYLGLNTMRDMGGQQAAAYGAMANAGYHFDFFAPSDPYALSATGYAQWLDSFVKAHPGSVTSIEGANEVNNWPITYNGSTSLASEAAYQQAMFNAVNADSTIANIPVFNLSMGIGNASGYTPLGNMASAVDYGNVHAYMSYGDQPNVELSRLISYAQAVTPGKPMAITESGYPTLASNTAQGVDQATQAKLTLNLVMDAEKLGDPLFIYELVDNQDSGGGAWNNGGLFNGDWSAKPAATAIHNLTTILTTGAGDTATAAPTYTVSGLSGYNNSMVVHESNGTYDIVVWDEPTIWNSTTHTEVAAPTQTATINLGQAVSSYSVYDPLTGSTAIANGGSASSISVQVTDHPVIIELHGQASGGSTGSTGGGTTSGGGSTGSSSGGTTGSGATAVSTSASPYTVPAGATDVTLTGSHQGVYGNNLGDTFHSDDSTTYIFGGTGNDTFDLGRNGDWAQGGGGNDVFAFAATPWAAGGITDFNAGDKVDLTGLLHSSGYWGSDPVGAGYIKITDDGAGDAQIWSNLGSQWWQVTTLEHVAASQVQVQGDLVVMAGSGGTSGGGTSGGGTSVTTSAASYTAPAGATDITLTGSHQAVYGNNLGDTFHSGDNIAYIFGGTGNDTFNLGRGGDWAQGGGGNDVFAFAATPWAAGGITDFNAGDKVDLTGLLHASGYTGSDPIGAGYVKITDDGAGDAQIWSHVNSQWWLVTTLDHVQASSLHMSGAFITG